MPPGWSTPRSSATRKGPRLPSSWSARCAGSAPRGSPWTASSPTTAVRIGPMPGGASAAWPGSVIAAPVRITPRPTARPSAGSRPPSVSASTSRCSTAASNAWPGWTSSSGGTTSTDLTAPTKGSRPALASLSCRRRECHQCPGGSQLAGNSRVATRDCSGEAEGGGSGPSVAEERDQAGDQRDQAGDVVALPGGQALLAGSPLVRIGITEVLLVAFLLTGRLTLE